MLDEELNNDIKKAAKEIIDEQIDIGIDVITDGEVERGITKFIQFKIPL